MVLTTITRCTLNSGPITRSAISSILTKNFIPVAKFSTTSHHLVFAHVSEEEKFEKYKEKSMKDPMHFQEKIRISSDEKTLAKIDEATTQSKEDYAMPHPCWGKEEAENVLITHRKPKGAICFTFFEYVVRIIQ